MLGSSLGSTNTAALNWRQSIYRRRKSPTTEMDSGLEEEFGTIAKMATLPYRLRI